MIKRVVSSAAARLGYTIVPTWQIETYHNVRHLRRIFDLLSIDLVIDVGANAGQFRDLLRGQVGYAGPVASFEPVPALADALSARAASDPLWTVERRALGAEPGTADFNVMKDTQFSSFRSPRHDDVTLFTTQNTVRERVTVEVTTIDAVLPDLVRSHGARAAYLKLDTQGYDLEALKGARASLPRIAALQTEASVRPIYDGAPDHREVIDFAVSQGFVVSGFLPNNEGSFPQLVEFDCHMIRRDLVSGPG